MVSWGPGLWMGERFIRSDSISRIWRDEFLTMERDRHGWQRMKRWLGKAITFLGEAEGRNLKPHVEGRLAAPLGNSCAWLDGGQSFLNLWFSAGDFTPATQRHSTPSARQDTKKHQPLRPLDSICTLADDNSKKADHSAVRDLVEKQGEPDDTRLQQWEDFGHQFQAGELELLRQSIAQMALSRIDGQDELFVGGLWALRRSDSLTDRRITHVLSLVPFDPSSLKNFKDEPWIDYGKDFRHLVIDIDDVDDADLLIELPKAVRFIEEGLRGGRREDGAKEDHDKEDGGVSLEEGVEDLGIDEKNTKGRRKKGGVFVHCAAGKSRSVSAVIAYLLWRYPNRFDPNITPTVISDPTHATPQNSAEKRSRKDTAADAVHAALTFVRRTRPMAEPNPGFMDQLALWWEMGCPNDVEAHPLYQRWAYRREVEENLAPTV
ncbi:hypothetical protein NM208_g15732 [Fusarium decemcellulare]|uniref:Uncharacterized protein n=1 Tax=Fusarium decemcellulare TaxID=57161 RepID=A0ACC1RCA8_9HYPO|nr:hypothetical protein NM208_g15732 [Fusarium decemcellulare]